MTFRYFAYGSNMFLPKLQKVAPSVSFYAVGKITGYKLLFNKQSQDGSGKANIVKTDSRDDIVEGVIFEIDNPEKESLGRSEGGYCPVGDMGIVADNGAIQARTYIARSDKIHDNLQPYDWYKEYIVRGAKNYELSQAYIDSLEQFKAVPDPDSERKKQHWDLLNQ